MNNKISFTLLLLIFKLNAFCQIKFEKEFDIYKTKMINEILIDLRKCGDNKLSKEWTNQHLEITCIPYCYFTTDTILDNFLIDSLAISLLRINESNVFVELSNQNGWIGIGYKTLKKDNPFNFESKDIIKEIENHSIGHEEVRKKEFHRIEWAKKYSKQLFYLKFYKSGTSPSKILAFIVGGKMKFIDDNMNYFDNVRDVLISIYGSLDKFKEFNELEDRKVIELEKLNNIEYCKQLVRNDYRSILKYFRNPDTSQILELFLDEMNCIAKFKDCQRMFLENKINQRLKANYTEPVDCYIVKEIIFMNKRLDKYLLEILTLKQFYDYKEFLSFRNQVYERAISELCNYFKEKKVPDNLIDETIISEVFN